MRFLPVLRRRQRGSVGAAAGCHPRLKPMTSSLGAKHAVADDRKRRELPEKPTPQPSQGSTRVEAGARGRVREGGNAALLPQGELHALDGRALRACQTPKAGPCAAARGFPSMPSTTTCSLRSAGSWPRARGRAVCWGVFRFGVSCASACRVSLAPPPASGWRSACAKPVGIDLPAAAACLGGLNSRQIKHL